jgi:hypothetical protein
MPGVRLGSHFPGPCALTGEGEKELVKRIGLTAVVTACLSVLPAPAAEATWVVGCLNVKDGWVCAPMPFVVRTSHCVDVVAVDDGCP